ncbi:MAG: hypothetical protein AB7P14_19730 [Blastocatellales bacterium]
MSRLQRSLSLPPMFGVLWVCLLFLISPCLAVAQDKTQKPEDNHLEDLSLRPIFVTSRIFQMTAPKESYQEINDQIFRMSTSSLINYDQWMKSFKKIYPEFEIGLLRTDSRRVFRTSKPGIVSLVKQADGRDIEVQFFGAQSAGEGETPGTSLIVEVGLHFPNAQTNKPISYAVRQLEVESGKTYFFAINHLKFTGTDYSKFVRPTAPADSMEGKDTFLLFAFSIDLDKTTQPARFIDERQSMEFQNQASKKVVPEVPAELRDAGFGGNIRVRVEVSPEGKVSTANVQYSGFPEMNVKAVESALQWEFPKTLFETDKTPITCFITFSFPAQPPTRKASATNPSK